MFLKINMLASMFAHGNSLENWKQLKWESISLKIF